MELAVQNNNVVKTASDNLINHVNNVKSFNRNNGLNLAKECDSQRIAGNEQCRDLLSTHVFKTQSSDTQHNLSPVDEFNTLCCVDNCGSE